MHYRSLVLGSILLAVATSANAKEPKAYQDATLVQMDSVPCGVDEKAGSGRTHELMCQEYVVEADQVVYRIRPKDAKHLSLLPVGERAKFRIEKNKMLLQAQVQDSKEHEYVVVSIKPRGESSADARASRVNHLQ